MLAYVGKECSLSLVLEDGETDLHPRAFLYLGDTAKGTVDMVHVAGGRYSAQHTFTEPGTFDAVFRVYTDSGHTTLADAYTPVDMDIQVYARDPDIEFQTLAGHNGENVRDDALSYDSNHKPLTFRRRIFPDAATAQASTPGGTGEGEILTITASASHFSDSQWTSLLRVKV